MGIETDSTSPGIPKELTVRRDGMMYYVPRVADGSATHGKNLKALHARMTLLNLLERDASVNALWDQWGERSGLYSNVEAAAGALDDIATAIGATHRSQLVDEKLAMKQSVIEAFDHPIRKSLWAEYMDKITKFRACFVPKHNWLGTEAHRFVFKEKGLNLDWLPEELVTLFEFRVFCHLHGVIGELGSIPLPPTPDCTVHIEFHPLRGESEKDAFERLKCQYDKARAELKEAYRASRGRAPTHGGETVVRHTEWYYRTKVGGEDPLDLARQRHAEEHPKTEFKHCDSCRTTIRAGVRAAEAALRIPLKWSVPTEPDQVKAPRRVRKK